ncbi:MAG: NAD(P)-dependent oxidoreductase [Fimbriiglobus sp.]
MRGTGITPAGNKRRRDVELKDYRVGVVGTGVVGRAVYRAYDGRVRKILAHDKVKMPFYSTLEETVRNSDVVFLCLPTPAAVPDPGEEPDNPSAGTLDLSAVYDVCDRLRTIDPDGNYVLRSTVPIGTTEYMKTFFGLKNIVHSPEFLTARTADWDAAEPAVNVVGKPGDWGPGEQCGEHPVVRLYRGRFPGRPIHPISSDESEAVKIFQNSFFAVKVAFFNEIKALSDRYGMDWEYVREAMLADGRINPLHTEVPGPDGLAGFGGACLPKDLACLVGMIDAVGLYSAVTSAAAARNAADRSGSIHPMTAELRSISGMMMDPNRGVYEGHTK